jgi:hypothetical protein
MLYPFKGAGGRVARSFFAGRTETHPPRNLSYRDQDFSLLRSSK